MNSIADTRPTAAGSGHVSLRGWLTRRGLLLLSTFLGLLPDGWLRRLASLIGGLLYRTRPARRKLARANLARVCDYLAANGMANPQTAAAATDPRVLERMTRTAFGHWVLGYLEAATLRRQASDRAMARVRPDDDAAALAAFPAGRSGPLIVVGMHFGAVEIPALWASRRGVPITAPMETVSNGQIQAYFEETRQRTGITIIPLAGAAPRLRATLAHEQTIALVADRSLAGSGARVELFGAITRLPLGPAVLAMETGAPAWLVAARRLDDGEYRAYLEQLVLPADGSPRQRMATFLANEARAMERAVSLAPEQWWTILFPIWDDIPGGAG